MLVSQEVSNGAIYLKTSTMFMTSKIWSFVTEQMANIQKLPRSHQSMHVSGITCSSTGSFSQAINAFSVSSNHGGGKELNITAVVLPTITNEPTVKLVAFSLEWHHLENIILANSSFGTLGDIDVRSEWMFTLRWYMPAGGLATDCKRDRVWLSSALQLRE